MQHQCNKLRLRSLWYRREASGIWQREREREKISRHINLSRSMPSTQPHLVNASLTLNQQQNQDVLCPVASNILFFLSIIDIILFNFILHVALDFRCSLDSQSGMESGKLAEENWVEEFHCHKLVPLVRPSTHFIGLVNFLCGSLAHCLCPSLIYFCRFIFPAPTIPWMWQRMEQSSFILLSNKVLHNCFLLCDYTVQIFNVWPSMFSFFRITISKASEKAVTAKELLDGEMFDRERHGSNGSESESENEEVQENNVNKNKSKNLFALSNLVAKVCRVVRFQNFDAPMTLTAVCVQLFCANQLMFDLNLEWFS